MSAQAEQRIHLQYMLERGKQLRVSMSELCPGEATAECVGVFVFNDLWFVCLGEAAVGCV